MTLDSDGGGGVDLGGEPIGLAPGADSTGLPSDSSGSSDPNTPPSSIDDLVSGIESELLGEAGASSASSPQTGDAAPSRQLDALDVFVQKNYNGDREAMLSAQFESRSETTRLRSELDTLKRQLEESRQPKVDPQAEFAAAREQDAHVQTINRLVTQAVNERTAIENRQRQVAADAGDLQKDIARLEGKINLSPDDLTLQRDLYSKKSELQGLLNEYNVNRSNLSTLGMQEQSIKLQLARAEQDVRDRLSAQRSMEVEQQLTAQQTIRVYDNAFINELDKYEVEGGAQSEEARWLYNTNKLVLADYLAQRGDQAGLSDEEIRNAVRSLMQSSAKLMKLKPKQGGSNGQTRRVMPAQPAPVRRPIAAPSARPTSPHAAARSTPSSPPRNIDDAFEDPEFVHRRAAAVLSRIGRGSGPR